MSAGFSVRNNAGKPDQPQGSDREDEGRGDMRKKRMSAEELAREKKAKQQAMKRRNKVEAKMRRNKRQKKNRKKEGLYTFSINFNNRIYFILVFIVKLCIIYSYYFVKINYTLIIGHINVLKGTNYRAKKLTTRRKIAMQKVSSTLTFAT